MQMECYFLATKENPKGSLWLVLSSGAEGTYYRNSISPERAELISLRTQIDAALEADVANGLALAEQVERAETVRKVMVNFGCTREQAEVHIARSIETGQTCKPEEAGLLLEEQGEDVPAGWKTCSNPACHIHYRPYLEKCPVCGERAATRITVTIPDGPQPGPVCSDTAPCGSVQCPECSPVDANPTQVEEDLRFLYQYRAYVIEYGTDCLLWVADMTRQNVATGYTFEMITEDDAMSHVRAMTRSGGVSAL